MRIVEDILAVTFLGIVGFLGAALVRVGGIGHFVKRRVSEINRMSPSANHGTDKDYSPRLIESLGVNIPRRTLQTYSMASNTE